MKANRTLDPDLPDVTPKAALLSHSGCGASQQPSAVKIHDAALDGAHRKALVPNSTLTGDANLPVMPNINAANIACNLLKTAAGGGIAIGPVLPGAAPPVHILPPSATVRRIVSRMALMVAEINHDDCADVLQPDGMIFVNLHFGHASYHQHPERIRRSFKDVAVVDAGEISNSIVFARKGHGFDPVRAGATRRPKDVDPVAGDPLPGALALIASALKDQGNFRPAARHR